MTHTDFQSVRLSMELLMETHAPLIHSLLQDESIYTYMPDDPPELNQLKKKYSFWENRVSPDQTEFWLNWIITKKATQEIIGTVQATVHRENHGASVAYTIGVQFQGQGYGTEAVRSMIHHLKENYQVCRVKAWIDTRNSASIRLVEKVGMKQVEYIEKADHFKGSDSDEYVYQLDY